jgi:hypothetical protein
MDLQHQRPANGFFQDRPGTSPRYPEPGGAAASAAAEFTFPGDPMRLDYAYRRNGTRGFVQTLSVTRAPGDAKLFAYTAERIAKISASEFTAVTDVPLRPENDRHRFVSDTVRDAGIEPVPMEGFAVWVAKLWPMLQ